jgi:hypothetical protein
MAQKTQAQIANEIATNITDNSNKENTAARVREVLVDMNDSYINLVDSTNYPTWKRISIDYSLFTAGALTESITIYTLAANEFIHDARIVPVTDFSGGAIASYTISVGITGDLTKWRGNRSVFTGNTTATLAEGASGGMGSFSVTTDVKATAITTVGNLNVATAGDGYIYLLTSILP